MMKVVLAFDRLSRTSKFLDEDHWIVPKQFVTQTTKAQLEFDIYCGSFIWLTMLFDTKLIQS